MNDMFSSQKLEKAKRALAKLVFAEVVSLVLEDKHITSPDGAPKTYRHYAGFARTDAGEFHFQRNGCSSDEKLCGFGIITKQSRDVPPRKNSLIVGTLGDRRIVAWSSCQEQEKIFAEYFLGKLHLSSSVAEREIELGALKIPGDQDQHEDLCSLARILILRDLDYFLRGRSHGKAELRDSCVYKVCELFELAALWAHYRDQAEAQLVYSTLVPQPANPRIRERRTTRDMGNPATPLNNPFGSLEVAAPK